MKKLVKNLISVILMLSILLSSSLNAFAVGDSSKSHFIYEKGDEIVIDNKHYSYDEFCKLLDTAVETEFEDTHIQTRSVGALVAGSFAIPGIGAFIVTAAGVIIFNDQIIEAGTKIYTTIMKWFEDRQHIAYQKVVDSIPKKLRNGNKVDLKNFKKRVRSKNGTGFQEEVTGQGWVIQKDDGKGNSHGGSAWKLKTKKQFDKGKHKERVATLTGDGTILRG